LRDEREVSNRKVNGAAVFDHERFTSPQGKKDGLYLGASLTGDDNERAARPGDGPQSGPGCSPAVVSVVE
jgi:hypothetical protein